jgi:hypothetical protein
MKANELRIGNLLNHNNGSMVGSFIVGLIHLEDIIKENSHAREYEPIPLTEEWLIKFGFEKSDNYGNDEYRLDGYSYFRGRFYISDCDECGEDVEINFVHELQNIYFALTKKELTIM